MSEWLERLLHTLQREPKDRDELIEVLHDAKTRQLLDNDALQMIEGDLQVAEMKVRDVMIPRPQMVVIPKNTTPESALPIIIESAHSRFPVIGESRDEIIGILLAKDLLQFYTDRQRSDLKIQHLIRPAIFIPESKRLNVLLKEFRVNRNHMAIVVDEYGGISGLVTIEDVLEQIVGDIVDETDIPETGHNIQEIDHHIFNVRALTPIDEFNEHMNTHFSDEDFDTIGGLVLQQFSHLPKRGESVQLDGYQVTVLIASNRGIQLLRFTRMEEE